MLWSTAAYRDIHTQSIPSSGVPYGWRTGMLPVTNHLTQLDDRTSNGVRSLQARTGIYFLLDVLTLTFGGIILSSSCLLVDNE